MDKASDPPINWHITALVRYGRQYFIFSDSFNPSSYQNSNPDKPRMIRAQKGLMHLLSILQMKKIESYPSLKTVSQNLVKGRGYKIDGIWWAVNL